MIGIRKVLDQIKKDIYNNKNLTVVTDSYGKCHVALITGEKTFRSYNFFNLGSHYTIFEIDGVFYCENNRTTKSKIFFKK